MRMLLPFAERPGDAGLLPRGDSRGPMPWIVAIMTCLAMLGLAGALALTPAAAGLSGQIAGRATIQIVDPDPISRRETVIAIRETLPEAPFVGAVRVVPEEELRTMASRWLGNGLSETGISLPALIDVDLVNDNGEGMERLRAAVAGISRNARVIAHASWLGPVAGLMRALGWLAAAVALALVIAAAAVAVITARAGLSAQAATIDILHQIGATDVQIARLFQRKMGRDCLWGVATGAAVATAILLLIGWQMRSIESGLATGGSWWSALLPYVVPPLILGVSVVAARRAVLTSLRRKL